MTELANALEAPLLGAHPDPPDTGNVKYYTLASDLREYARLDSGLVVYRNPKIHLWEGVYFGTTAGLVWLRNGDASLESRRTNFICPFNIGRITSILWSSRNDLSLGASLRIRIHEDGIGAVGDVSTADPVTQDIFHTDTEMTAYRDGKRFFGSIADRNVEVDNTKRYAATIDNVGDATSYRDVRVCIAIEERAAQP